MSRVPGQAGVISGSWSLHRKGQKTYLTTYNPSPLETETLKLLETKTVSIRYVLIQAALVIPVASIWMLVQFLSVTLEIVSGSRISRAADVPWARVDVEPPAVPDSRKFA